MVQVLDVRHCELFLEEEFWDGTWEYEDLGQHFKDEEVRRLPLPVVPSSITTASPSRMLTVCLSLLIIMCFSSATYTHMCMNGRIGIACLAEIRVADSIQFFATSSPGSGSLTIGSPRRA